MMSILSGEIKEKVIHIVWSYCPLQIWTLKTCNEDVSKSIISRSFKLGQLIEDDFKVTFLMAWLMIALLLEKKNANQPL